MLIWGNTSYATLSAFVSGTGQELHGIQTDPLWVDAAGTISTSGRDRRPSTRPTRVPAVSSCGRRWQPSRERPVYRQHRSGAARIRRPRCIRVPAGDGPDDQAPSASLVVTPSSGAAPLQVTADGSGRPTPMPRRSPPTGSTSATAPRRSDHRPAPTATHTYTAAGTYTVDASRSPTRLGWRLRRRSGHRGVARRTAGRRSDRLARLGHGAVAGHGRRLGVDRHRCHADRHLPVRLRRRHRAVGPQAGATANHTYTSAGTYTVTVTVTDTAGLSSTATAQVTVNRRRMRRRPPP